MSLSKPAPSKVAFLSAGARPMYAKSRVGQAQAAAALSSLALKEIAGVLHIGRPTALTSESQDRGGSSGSATIVAVAKSRRRRGKDKSGSREGNAAGESPQFLPLAVLPFRMRTRQFFSEYDGILSAASSGYLVLRPNTVYDPDSHIAGGYVPGTSEFGAFYSKFRVDRFRIRLGAQSPGTAALSVFAVGWPAKAACSGSESFLTASAQPLAGTIWAQPQATELVTPWFSCAAILGRAEDEYRADPNTWGSSGSDPATYVYYNLMAFSSGSATGTVLYSIEFDVEWFNRLELSS